MNGFSIDKIVNVAGAIVTVALVTTLVRPGSQTASVVKAFGQSFSGALTAAMGR